MENQKILELMARFEASGLSRMEVQTQEFTVKFRKEISAPANCAAAPLPEADDRPEPTGEFLKAPLVGTYYSAPAPGAAPYAAVGQTIAKGSPICMIEAMKSMNEIPAHCDLVVEELLAQDGELVAYGAPILRFRHV